MIKELLDKIRSKETYYIRMQLVYMWIKQEHITLAQFLILIAEIRKMEDTEPDLIT